jgi:uncharacterized protein (TIGR00297 family)
MQPVIGLILAIGIAFMVYRLRALTPGGAVAAAILGTLIFGLGGVAWSILLLVFFISSSALSRLAKQRKQAVEENYAKGDRRDAGQVLANGGVAGLFVILHAFFPAATWPWLGAAAGLAAATADTWATELGVLSPNPPRLITTGRQVERGASGGVSLVGLAAALAGSSIEAASFVIVWPETGLMGGAVTPHALSMAAAWFLLVALAGLAGSLVDSLLGATLQAIYYCPACHKETERHPLHSCGAATSLRRGLPWLNNDWVNAACTFSAALLALIIYFVI